MRTSVVAVLLALLASCTGGATTAECDKGCRNYYQLHYWQEVEAEAEKLPEAERDALRKQRLADLPARMDLGIPQCVAQCAKVATPEISKCMVDAKSAAEAKKCIDL